MCAYRFSEHYCSVTILYYTNWATRSKTYAPTDIQSRITRLLDFTITTELPAVTYAPNYIESTIALSLVYNVPTELPAVSHMHIPIFRAGLLFHYSILYHLIYPQYNICAYRYSEHDCSVTSLYYTNWATRSNICAYRYSEHDFSISNLYCTNWATRRNLYAPTDIQSIIARSLIYTIPTELTAVTHMRLPIFKARLLPY